MDLNRAEIIGRLTKDPEVRQTPSGQTVISFTVATNYVRKNAAGERVEQTEFHNCVVWGKLAEICGQYLVKGKQVYVEGRLQTRKWQAQDGSEKQRTEIVADTMQMLGRAGDSPARRSAPAQSAPPIEETPNESPVPEGDEGIKVEEIPF